MLRTSAASRRSSRTRSSSPRSSRQPAIRFEHVSKTYGTETADRRGVFDVSFEIFDGEFATLVGPSGCGKTTILRLMAGFLAPTEGRIFISDRLVAEPAGSVPPNRRDLAMVFQSYALWPHMTVYDNVVFGLRAHRVPEPERSRRARETLDLVGMAESAGRLPSQLSGGQQQRVALARSLVLRPRLLLLDEPLSNLDAELRLQMREQLKALQRTTEVTFVYVTHDQEEALAMSDHILVLERGRLLQAGTPEEVYLRPADDRVARFVGHACTIPGVLVEDLGNGLGRLKPDRGPAGVTFVGTLPRERAIAVGARACLALRSEAVRRVAAVDDAEGTPACRMTGVLRSASYVGRENHLEVELPTGDRVTVFDAERRPVELNTSVALAYDPRGGVLIPLAG